MPITIIFGVLGLAALAVIFVAAYLIKGIKVALIATGAAAIALVLLYVVFIFVAASSMN